MTVGSEIGGEKKRETTVAGSRGKLPDQVSSGREADTDGNVAEKGVHDSAEGTSWQRSREAFDANRRPAAAPIFFGLGLVCMPR